MQSIHSFARLCLLLLFLSPIYSLNAQFQRVYGTANEETFKDFGVDGQGNIIVLVDYLNNAPSSVEKGMLMVLDAVGNPLTSQIFGGTANDYTENINVLPSGDLIVAGYTDEAGPGSVNGYFVRLDTAGNIAWAKSSGFGLLEEFTSLDAMPNGDLIAAGFSFQGGIDGYVARIDTNGNVIWQRTVGNVSTAELPFDALATSDNGVLLYGATSQGVGSDDVFFTKLDSTGALQWTRIYGTTFQDGVRGLAEHPNGGFVFAGGSNQDILLGRLDASGGLSWSKTFSGAGAESIFDLHVNAAGEIILAGFSSTPVSGVENGILIKTDSSGVWQWGKYYGGANDERFTKVIPYNSGYLAGGTAESFAFGQADVFLVNTDAQGVSGCNEGTFTLTSANVTLSSTTPAPFVSTSGGSVLIRTHSSTAASPGDSVLCSACLLAATVSFSNMLYCTGDTLFATNTTAGAVNSTWLDSLGNVLSTSGSFSQILSQSGTFEFTLITDDGSSCADTLTNTVSIADYAVISMPLDTGCIGDSFLVSNVTPGALGSAWELDGTPYSVDFNATIPFVSPPGTHTIRLYSTGTPLTCPQDVSFYSLPVPAVTFSFTNTNLTYDFTETSTGAISWSWDFGDGNTSTQQNPQHTYATPGQFAVCVTVANVEGCTHTWCDSVDVLTGVNPAEFMGLEIFPNPAGDWVNVRLATAPPQAWKLNMRDLTGKLIQSSEYAPGISETQIHLAGFPSGFYLLEVVSEQGRVTQKLRVE